jgi:hypothetical protein
MVILIFFWKDDKYYDINNLNKDIYIEKYKLFICRNYTNLIPDDAKIVYLFYSLDNESINLPANLQYLFYAGLLSSIANINLPIELKVLFLSKKLNSECINKIKIPFGCKIIFY